MISLLFAAALSCSAPATDSIPPPPPVPDEEVIFCGIPEEPPTMPLCDNYETAAERKACMDEHILKIIYGNLRWPDAMQNNCVEGMAVVSFTVTGTGELTDFDIVRNPGGGTGEEALRLVKLLAEETGPWHPGTIGRERKPVTVRYTIPVKFKLE